MFGLFKRWAKKRDGDEIDLRKKFNNYLPGDNKVFVWLTEGGAHLKMPPRGIVVDEKGNIFIVERFNRETRQMECDLVCSDDTLVEKIRSVLEKHKEELDQIPEKVTEWHCMLGGYFEYCFMDDRFFAGLCMRGSDNAKRLQEICKEIFALSPYFNECGVKIEPRNFDRSAEAFFEASHFGTYSGMTSGYRIMYDGSVYEVCSEIIHQDPYRRVFDKFLFKDTLFMKQVMDLLIAEKDSVANIPEVIYPEEYNYDAGESYYTMFNKKWSGYDMGSSYVGYPVIELAEKVVEMIKSHGC